MAPRFISQHALDSTWADFAELACNRLGRDTLGMQFPDMRNIYLCQFGIVMIFPMKAWKMWPCGASTSFRISHVLLLCPWIDVHAVDTGGNVAVMQSMKPFRHHLIIQQLPTRSMSQTSFPCPIFLLNCHDPVALGIGSRCPKETTIDTRTTMRAEQYIRPKTFFNRAFDSPADHAAITTCSRTELPLPFGLTRRRRSKGLGTIRILTQHHISRTALGSVDNQATSLRTKASAATLEQMGKNLKLVAAC